MKRKKIDRKRFGLGGLHECFANAERVFLEHGGQDANLRYVEGHIGGGIEHAWLEDAKTGTIYEVTVPEFYEVREYKDGVPQEWTTQKTRDDQLEYIAVVKVSYADVIRANKLLDSSRDEIARRFGEQLSDRAVLQTLVEARQQGIKQ